MSPDSPTLPLAELKRTPAGRIRGIAWDFRRGTPQHAWDLKIDLKAASKFFRLLADAPIVTTPYSPLIDHTDDFPDISIAVAHSRGLGFDPPQLHENPERVRLVPGPFVFSGGPECGWFPRVFPHAKRGDDAPLSSVGDRARVGVRQQGRPRRCVAERRGDGRRRHPRVDR